jgi:hypothetical protein
MGKKSQDAPDYTELANVSREAVGVARDMGNRQMDFSERQYEELKPIFDQIAQGQIAAQDQQLTQAADYYQYQQDTFRPVEQGIVADAANFNSESYRQLQSGEAAAASGRAFGNTQAALSRSDAARGLNPNSPAARAARQQATLGLSASSANAQTNASSQAQSLGYARSLDAAGLGRGLAGASSAAYQGSVNAGSAGAGTYQAAGNQYSQGLGQAAGIMNSGYATGIGGFSSINNTQASVYNAGQQATGEIFGGILGLGGSIGGGYFGAKRSATPSDRRLKQDIEFHRYDQSLDLNYYTFSYKAAPDRKFIGFMADEVRDKYPTAVLTDKHGMMHVDYSMLNTRMVEITGEVA